MPWTCSSWSPSSLLRRGLTDIDELHAGDFVLLIIDELDILARVNDDPDSIDSDGSLCDAGSEDELEFTWGLELADRFLLGSWFILLQDKSREGGPWTTSSSSFGPPESPRLSAFLSCELSAVCLPPEYSHSLYTLFLLGRFYRSLSVSTHQNTVQRAQCSSKLKLRLLWSLAAFSASPSPSPR